MKNIKVKAVSDKTKTMNKKFINDQICRLYLNIFDRIRFDSSLPDVRYYENILDIVKSYKPPVFTIDYSNELLNWYSFNNTFIILKPHVDVHTSVTHRTEDSINDCYIYNEFYDAFSCRDDLFDEMVDRNDIKHVLRTGLGMFVPVKPQKYIDGMRKIESHLRLSLPNRTKIIAFNVKGRKNIYKNSKKAFMVLKLHPFWVSNILRFCFLTAYLKAIPRLVTNKDMKNWKQSILNEEKYFKPTKEATELFLSGYTTFNWEIHDFSNWVGSFLLSTYAYPITILRGFQQPRHSKLFLNCVPVKDKKSAIKTRQRIISDSIKNYIL